jgi:hypothetical protein
MGLFRVCLNLVSATGRVGTTTFPAFIIPYMFQRLLVNCIISSMNDSSIGGMSSVTYELKREEARRQDLK